MKLNTALPVDCLAFKHWAPDDSEMMVIVAKACFGWDGAQAHALDVPPKLVLEDVMAQGPEGYAPVLSEQDTAPGKTGTDLTVQGVARSPRGVPMTDWPVSVSVPGILRNEFHVRGPSQWKRGTLQWSLTPPEPVVEVPLSYTLAFGGTVPPGVSGPVDTPIVYEMNPAGVGFVTAERLKDDTPFPAPQIGILPEFLANDPLLEMRVCGTMPIAKGWLPRRAFAGTFDEDWQRSRQPRMPEDYSFDFWNHAPSALQVRPSLKGDETIVLEGFLHTGPASLTLPGVGIVAHLPDAAPVEHGNPGYTASMTLDTIKVNATSPDPSMWNFELVWRCALAAFGLGETLELHGVGVTPAEAS